MINSRQKGKRGELELVHLLQEAGFPRAARSYHQARGGSDAPDITGVPGWWIECKRGARPDIRRAFAQATRDMLAATSGQTRYVGDGKVLRPVAVTRDDGGDWLVTMGVNEWLELIR